MVLVIRDLGQELRGIITLNYVVFKGMCTSMNMERTAIEDWLSFQSKYKIVLHLILNT